MWFGGGAALRLRSVSRSSPPALRLPARRRQAEAKEPRQQGTWWIRQSETGESSFLPPPILRAPSHSADRRDSAMETRLIVGRRRARQGYYGSVRLNAPASVPPLTRPPTPGTFASRFSSREAVAVQPQNTNPLTRAARKTHFGRTYPLKNTATLCLKRWFCVAKCSLMRDKTAR